MAIVYGIIIFNTDYKIKSLLNVFLHDSYQIKINTIVPKCKEITVKMMALLLIP